MNVQRTDGVRLLRTYEHVNNRTMDDLIYVAALNVEDALLTGGAVPGVDYTLIDLFRIGMPFAILLRKEGRDYVGHTTCYPDGHPKA